MQGSASSCGRKRMPLSTQNAEKRMLKRHQQTTFKKFPKPQFPDWDKTYQEWRVDTAKKLKAIKNGDEMMVNSLSVYGAIANPKINMLNVRIQLCKELLAALE